MSWNVWLKNATQICPRMLENTSWRVSNFKIFQGRMLPGWGGGGKGGVAPQRASYSVQIRHLLHFLMTILEHDTLMQHKYCWNICPFYMRTDNYARHAFIVDRGVYMRVHKHSCDVLGLCVFFRNILQKQQNTFSMFTC